MVWGEREERSTWRCRAPLGVPIALWVPAVGRGGGLAWQAGRRRESLQAPHAQAAGGGGCTAGYHGAGDGRPWRGLGASQDGAWRFPARCMREGENVPPRPHAPLGSRDWGRGASTPRLGAVGGVPAPPAGGGRCPLRAAWGPCQRAGGAQGPSDARALRAAWLAPCPGTLTAARRAGGRTGPRGGGQVGRGWAGLGGRQAGPELGGRGEGSGAAEPRGPRGGRPRVLWDAWLDGGSRRLLWDACLGGGGGGDYYGMCARGVTIMGCSGGYSSVPPPARSPQEGRAYYGMAGRGRPAPARGPGRAGGGGCKYYGMPKQRGASVGSIMGCFL